MKRLAACAVGIVAATPFATLAEASGTRGVNVCRIGQMRLAIGSLVSEKTEQHTAAFALHNLARRACSLRGYPSVTLLDAAGRVLPFRYGHRGDQMVTAAPPKWVTVTGGGSAYFELNKNACVSYTSRAATEIRVRPPGVQGALSLPLPH